MTKKKDVNLCSEWSWRIAKAGLTQCGFALNHAKVTAANLSQYINGRIKPRPLTREKIEKALRDLGV